MRRAPSLAQLWPFLAVALPVLASLLASMSAVDLAYQLRAGGGILDSRAIPAFDSWTSSAPVYAPWSWLDQQWGAEVLLALVYRAAGWTGLAILRAALVGLTCWLLLLLARRRSPRLGPMGATLLVLAAFAIMASSVALRPQLLAIPLFGLSLLLIADRETHPRRLWAIPLITLLWANLQGAFPLVLVLLGLALVSDFLDRRTPRLLGAVTLASAAATLVNPFGFDVWRYVVNVATNPAISSRVSEGRPPTPTDPPGILFYLSALAVVALLVMRARRAPDGTRRLPGWPAILTLLAFGALAAVTGRGLAWWPPAALFVVAPLSAEVVPVLRLASSARPSRLNTWVMALFAVVAVGLLPAWRPLGPAGVPVGTLSNAPQGIAAALRQGMDRSTISGVCGGPSSNRMWVPQVWASWFEFAAPNWKYEVDSRIEIFPGYVWIDYDTVEGGDPINSLLFACRHAYTWIVTMPTDTALLYALVTTRQWIPVYHDADGTIWARQ